MTVPSVLYASTSGKIVAIDENIDGPYYIEEENYILMQYTGLKDRNGKEIYEGDLFVGRGGPRPWIVRQVNEVNGIMEVIGNIYENPELLENV
jgi:hypothetical protein